MCVEHEVDRQGAIWDDGNASIDDCVIGLPATIWGGPDDPSGSELGDLLDQVAP